jgi:dipeptidyl aminopeptidase/acylaminoacyl peptidase
VGRRIVAPSRAARRGPAHTVAMALAATAVVAGAPAPALARPFQLEDMLNREDFGAVLRDPSGRWAVIEHRGPYAAGIRFDVDTFTDVARTRLERLDLRDPRAPRPLFRSQSGEGYSAGAFSPDGQRIAVYRLTARTWELGVATLATGEVRWLGITPDLASDAQSLAWTSPTTLLVLARPTGDLPYLLSHTPNAARFAPPRWQATARGAGAVTVVGSGRLLADGAKPSVRRLLQIDVARGRRRVLAQGRFMDLEPSPTGRHVALLEEDGPLPMAAGRPIQGAYGFAIHSHHLRVLEIATGRLTAPCGDEDVLLHPLAWSPTGGDLLVFARSPDRPWTSGQLRRIDVRQSRAEVVGMGGLAPALEFRPEAVRAGWFAGDPLVWAAAAATPSAAPGWYRLAPTGPVALTAGLHAPSRDSLVATRTALLLDADGAAWAIAPDGARRRLAEGIRPVDFGQVSRAWTFDYRVPTGDRLLARRTDGPADTLVAITAGSVRNVAPLPAGAGVTSAIGAWQGVLVRRQGPGGQGSLAWVRGDGALRTVETINPGLADLDAPQVLPVAHQGRDGAVLASWLLLPAKSAAERPPPLIVWAYPGYTYADGPPTSVDGRDPEYEKTPALLASAGFAVLIPSLPKRTGPEDPTVGLAAEILAIVDAAAAQRDLAGRFDPDRLGLWGASYGGYAALAVLTQTQRFKAAIAQSAPSDLFSMWGEFGPSARMDAANGLSLFYSGGWTEDFQGAMYAPPFQDPQRYLRNSPALQADRIETPLLLLHGDQDTIPIGQAEEMFAGLLRQNKDAELVTYWGEGHAIANPGNLRDLYARAAAWFGRYLGPVSSPAAAPGAHPGPGSANAGSRPRSPRR